MAEQLALYDVPPIPPKQCDKQKKSWEDGFQRWSNKQFGEGGSGYGACGYGSMCDYCEDNTYGRPCVRALNDMCRTERITIDYSKRNYEDIWDGDSVPTEKGESENEIQNNQMPFLRRTPRTYHLRRKPGVST